LAIANLALLVNYTLRASSDILRIREEWGDARKHFEIEKISRAQQQAVEIEKELMEAGEDCPGAPGMEEYWEDYRRAANKARERILEIETALGDRRLPISVRWIRLFYFGCLPLLIGSLAFLHTWRDALEFFQAVVII
jgi:hypothetical protein